MTSSGATGFYHTLSNGVRHQLTPAELYAYDGEVWPGFVPPEYDANGQLTKNATFNGRTVTVPEDLDAALAAQYGLAKAKPTPKAPKMKH